MSEPARQTEEIQRAIELCRASRWREGYDRLSALMRTVEEKGKLPGHFYSFFGAAMARCEGRKKEGLELCRYAVKREPRQADNYYNLGTVYLMYGRRPAAVRALERGLALAPRHEGLLQLRTELGVLRRPLFPFLHRDHFLNVLGGRLRHAVAGPKDLQRERWPEAQDEPEDDEERVTFV